MDKIYVTGHRNPDTDSIVSAMAYAALRNAVGDREYVAARLGQLSDETRAILARFGFEAPLHLKNVRTQVQDLDYDQPPILNAAVTVNRAWSAMEEDKHISAIPITDDDGHLKGMLTAGDIAGYDMHTITDPSLRKVPIFNILSVLEGQLLTETDQVVNTISGDVILALPEGTDLPPYRKKETVLICGHQPELLRQAVEFGVGCIILCQAELPDDIRKLAKNTCIISTPCDSYRTVRRIFQAIPVSRVAQKQDLQFFRLDDYIDDVREVVLQSRYRSYPILDADDRVVGTLSRYHLIRPRHKRVVLVDHNEAAQSVPGLDQADILAIIDHHRLADIQTRNPIYVRNEPVGSTTTIVAGMYQERGLMPSAKPPLSPTPSCSSPPPALPGTGGWRSGWPTSRDCPWTIWARRSSPPPPPRTSRWRSCCSATSRSSTLPVTTSASVRSPVWTPTASSSGRSSSWSSWPRPRRSTATA